MTRCTHPGNCDQHGIHDTDRCLQHWDPTYRPRPIPALIPNDSSPITVAASHDTMRAMPTAPPVEPVKLTADQIDTLRRSVTSPPPERPAGVALLGMPVVEVPDVKESTPFAFAVETAQRDGCEVVEHDGTHYAIRTPAVPELRDSIEYSEPTYTGQRQGFVARAIERLFG